jgi:hypothetical protein
MHRKERLALEGRLRNTAQILIAEIGADGPCNAEDAATRIVAKLNIAIRNAQQEHESANEAHGLLADICDALFGDEERALNHGYEGVVEKAKELRAEVARLRGELQSEANKTDVVLRTLKATEKAVAAETKISKRNWHRYQAADKRAEQAEAERDARRDSLAQEIAETLRSRGHWTPKEYLGDNAADLIVAVAKALTAAESECERLRGTLKAEEEAHEITRRDLTARADKETEARLTLAGQRDAAESESAGLRARLEGVSGIVDKWIAKFGEGIGDHAVMYQLRAALAEPTTERGGGAFQEAFDRSLPAAEEVIRDLTAPSKEPSDE